MRIVVMGNCQSHGIAHSLAHLLPEARVEVAQLDGPSPTSPRYEAAAKTLDRPAILVTQVLDARYGKLSTAELARSGRRVLRVPRVAFNGYQPDIAYLHHKGQQLHSPIGAYHSSIIAAAFSLGVAETDVATLFNRMVFARLGHLDAFGKARTLMAQQLAPFGEAMVAAFDAWHAAGPFMHTSNHPRVHVLADIARLTAIGGRLLPADAPRVTPVFDHLASNVVWPVYPGLAERLGVPGSLVFKRAAPPEATGHALHYGLPAFIRTSFARYRTVPAEAFRTGPIGETRAALAEFLGYDGD